MPATLITFAQRSVSSAMNCPKSAAVPPGIRMDFRWAPGSVDRMRTFAKELVELRLDVILANSTPVTAALQRETRTIPIVFAVVSDPVGSGFVASRARPGGNITGFSIAEPSLPSCVETLEDAVARHGKPDIFNTDQARARSSKRV